MAGPKNVTAFEGTQARLSCHADGYPGNVTYRWFHQGNPMFNRKRAQLLRNNWSPFSDPDDDIDDFDDSDEIEGDVIDSDEQHTGLSKTVPRLTHLSRRQQQQHRPRLRYDVLEDGTLLIRNVTPTDLGWYSCRPTIDLETMEDEDDRGATTLEAKAYLNVTC